MEFCAVLLALQQWCPNDHFSPQQLHCGGLRHPFFCGAKIILSIMIMGTVKIRVYCVIIGVDKP